MSVTLIYIPRKYKPWERIPEDIRNHVIEITSKDIAGEKAEYEYLDVDVPIANECLPLAWDKLIDKGYLTESNFGYYNDSDDVMVCPIFQNVINLISILNIKIDNFGIGSDYCSSIANMSSENYLPKLRSVMIEEFFK